MISEGREPLRLVVPAGVPIELWDSGLAISAHDGDTLQTIATTYHVPLWTLTQLNKVSETAAITEGQRIVTPAPSRPETAVEPSSELGLKRSDERNCGRYRAKRRGGDQLTCRYTRRGSYCARTMNLFRLATSLFNQRQKPVVD